MKLYDGVDNNNNNKLIHEMIVLEKQCYDECRRLNRLVCIPFETVTEYLSLLEFISMSLHDNNNNNDNNNSNSNEKTHCDTTQQLYGCMKLIYCAAAVSDFYLPKHEMSVHKIQSTTKTTVTDNSNNATDATTTTAATDVNNKRKRDSDNSTSSVTPVGALVPIKFTLSLAPVPKLLGKLTSQYCPHSFIVSFKLETDENILIHKAESAINSYNMNIVVANLLQVHIYGIVIVVLL